MSSRMDSSFSLPIFFSTNTLDFGGQPVFPIHFQWDPMWTGDLVTDSRGNWSPACVAGPTTHMQHNAMLNKWIWVNISDNNTYEVTHEKKQKKQGYLTLYRASFPTCCMKAIIFDTAPTSSVVCSVIGKNNLPYCSLSGGRHRRPAGHADLRGVLRLLQNDVPETGRLPADDGLQRQEGSPDRRRARQLPAQRAEGERRLWSAAMAHHPARPSDLPRRWPCSPHLAWRLAPPPQLSAHERPISHPWNGSVSWVSPHCPPPLLAYLCVPTRCALFPFKHGSGWIFHRAAFTVTPATRSVNSVGGLFCLFVMASEKNVGKSVCLHLVLV